MARFEKDPQAVLDFVVDWSQWLGTDTIATATWSDPAPAGITIVTSTKTNTECTVWLSGGTVDQVYSLTNKIVTVGGRTDERTIEIVIKNR